MENTTPVQPVITPIVNPVSNANLSRWETLAAFLGKFVNDETSIGKAGKAGKWAGLTAIIIAVITALVAQPALFAALHWGGLFVVLNVILVLLNNLFNPNIKNF